MLFDILGSDISAQSKFITLVSYVFALLIALICHEVAHGIVAKWNGDDTAFLAGRLSLNPAKHLDPIGTICLLLIGFGWAKPVPINTRNFKNFRVGLFTVSIAGITVNLILALIFAGIYHLLNGLVSRVVEIPSELALNLFLIVYNLSILSVLINLTLMVFNLLPVNPLDGFRVVESLGAGKSEAIDKYINFCRRNGAWLTLAVILFVNFTGILGGI
ncbi:MAG: site-2 protease family protein, partial [Clostridiales bacterium]|nr:site-2 protease family protein [Clostridiales bacterium]